MWLRGAGGVGDLCPAAEAATTHASLCMRPNAPPPPPPPHTHTHTHAHTPPSPQKVLITCSAAMRGTKRIALKQLADDACRRAAEEGHAVGAGRTGLGRGPGLPGGRALPPRPRHSQPAACPGAWDLNLPRDPARGRAHGTCSCHGCWCFTTAPRAGGRTRPWCLAATAGGRTRCRSSPQRCVFVCVCILVCACGWAGGRVDGLRICARDMEAAGHVGLVGGLSWGLSLSALHTTHTDTTTQCEVEWVDSEDPLFVLYTSGSTGKPKGVVHATGGEPRRRPEPRALPWGQRPELCVPPSCALLPRARGSHVITPPSMRSEGAS